MKATGTRNMIFILRIICNNVSTDVCLLNQGLRKEEHHKLFDMLQNVTLKRKYTTIKKVSMRNED